MSFKDYLNVYTFDYVLPGTEEKIQFKPLTTKEIKKLLVYENDNDYGKIEEVLDEIINLSVTNENFDVNNLYLQDRFSLLLEIRKKTKGEYYEFPFDCPKCSSQNYMVIDLDKLNVTRLNDLGELDTVVNLTDQISIEVWFLTRKEEKEAWEKVSNDSPQPISEYELNILTQTIKAVNSPDGREDNLSFEDKQFIIDNTTTGNLQNISKWFEKNNFGTDFTIKRVCKQCGYTETRSIPLVNFFF